MPDTSKNRLVYSVKIETGNDQFTLRVLHIQTLNTWRNSFKKSFIEQLTKRTGNYKAYEAFTSMLDFVLDKSNKTSRELTFSILTLADLQKMRDSKHAEKESKNYETDETHANDTEKRYFILKYRVFLRNCHEISRKRLKTGKNGLK